MRISYGLILILCLAIITPPVLAEELTQGRDFDTATVAAPFDEGVFAIVYVRTNGLRVNSSSSITLADNGQALFGPESRADATWRERVRVAGKGVHNLRVDCGHANSRPVSCRIEIEDQRVDTSLAR
jgi:hypothetical protein